MSAVQPCYTFAEAHHSKEEEEAKRAKMQGILK